MSSSLGLIAIRCFASTQTEHRRERADGDKNERYDVGHTYVYRFNAPGSSHSEASSSSSS
ncbi:MAG: hypothetical protein QOH92_2541 [Chloroflexota bacterium]|nr:hypothetical protein [Chloroflexota bacterium]